MSLRRISAVFLISMVCGCGLFPQPITVPGPESDSLLPTAKGFIVLEQAPGGVVAVQLPTLRKTTLRPQSSDNFADMAIIYALSGPDNLGRIAYIEDHFYANGINKQRHLLKTVRLDGSEDTVIFSHTGSALWAETSIGQGEIGHSISFAPTGGRVAFLSGLKDLQMPSAFLSQGSIEIWNIDQKTGKKTNLRGLDQGLSWFPDGKRLAYVKMVSRLDARVNNRADPIAVSFLDWNWDRIPAVFICDVDSQTETFLHAGWCPIVSIDGSKAIIGDRDGSSYCVDIGTGKTSSLTGPGKNGPIAMLDDRTLLAACYPTAGTKVKFSGAWPVNGPAEMFAVKLTRTDSQAFQTVIPYIASRTHISFGLGRKYPPSPANK